MLQCCLMNGYCPYYSINELYLSCTVIILLLLIIIESIYKIA